MSEVHCCFLTHTASITPPFIHGEPRPPPPPYNFSVSILSLSVQMGRPKPSVDILSSLILSHSQVSEKQHTHIPELCHRTYICLKFIKIVIGAWSNELHIGKNDRREQGPVLFLLSLLFTPALCPCFCFLPLGFFSCFFHFHCHCQESYHIGMHQVSGH